MFMTFLADAVMIPAVLFLIARFTPRKNGPEWMELNRFRAYLRSPEFIKKHEKLMQTYLKGGGDHD